MKETMNGVPEVQKERVDEEETLSDLPPTRVKNDKAHKSQKSTNSHYTNE
jgi:hypothetical protein